ncbi:MAG: GNAT family N-acetyltransferase [Candidatus Thermoplasmatota archaeon]
MKIKSYESGDEETLEELYGLWKEVAKERPNTVKKDLEEFEEAHLKTSESIDLQCFTVHENSKLIGASILKMRPGEANPFLNFLVPKEKLRSEGSKELLERSIEYCKKEEELEISLSANIYPQEVIDFFKEQGFEKSEDHPSGVWMKKDLEDLSESKSPESIDIFGVEDLEGAVSARDLAQVHLDYSDDDSFELEDHIDEFEKLDREQDDILYGIAKLEDSDEVVGFSRTVFVDLLRGDSIAQNVGLVVKEEHREKGIGGTLLVDSFHRAKERGYEKMYISTHSKNPAQRLYREVGFELESEHPNLSYRIEDLEG